MNVVWQIYNSAKVTSPYKCRYDICVLLCAANRSSRSLAGQRPRDHKHQPLRYAREPDSITYFPAGREQKLYIHTASTYRDPAPKFRPPLDATSRAARHVSTCPAFGGRLHNRHVTPPVYTLRTARYVRTLAAVPLRPLHQFSRRHPINSSTPHRTNTPSYASAAATGRPPGTCRPGESGESRQTDTHRGVRLVMYGHGS